MFLIPHESIPQHYVVDTPWVLQTTDMTETYFRWSRMIHNNYIQHKGFLTNNPAKRICFYGFERVRGTECEVDLAKEVDPEAISNELLELLEPGKATLLHYSPEGYIRDIIVNVDVNALHALPEQYRPFYYDHA